MGRSPDARHGPAAAGARPPACRCRSGQSGSCWRRARPFQQAKAKARKASEIKRRLVAEQVDEAVGPVTEQQQWQNCQCEELPVDERMDEADSVRTRFLAAHRTQQVGQEAEIGLRGGPAPGPIGARPVSSRNVGRAPIVSVISDATVLWASKSAAHLTRAARRRRQHPVLEIVPQRIFQVRIDDKDIRRHGSRQQAGIRDTSGHCAMNSGRRESGRSRLLRQFLQY